MILDFTEFKYMDYCDSDKILMFFISERMEFHVLAIEHAYHIVKKPTLNIYYQYQNNDESTILVLK